MAIQKGSKVKIDYVGRTPDGEVFDSSKREVAEEHGLTDDPHNQGREYKPLEFEVGAEQVIEGLEEGLMGMEEGDEDTITIEPDKGYGDRREELVVEYDREEFEGMIGDKAEEGMHIHAQDGSHGDVTDVTDDEVKVDFNHELAGETLEFEVEIVEVN